MCIREVGLFSAAMPSCEKGFCLDVSGVCDRAGGDDWSFGVALPGDEAAGAGEGRELPAPADGPPSFARRFARICSLCQQLH